MSPEAQDFVREFLTLDENGVLRWQADPRAQHAKTPMGKRIGPGDPIRGHFYDRDTRIRVEPASAVWLLAHGEPADGPIRRKNGDATDFRLDNLFLDEKPTSIPRDMTEAVRERLLMALAELDRFSDRAGITVEQNAERRRQWDRRFARDAEGPTTAGSATI